MPLNTEKLRSLFAFEESADCTPIFLVVTDDLNFEKESQLSLSVFVNTLRDAKIYRRSPIVVTAIFKPDNKNKPTFNPSSQHIENYKFTDAQYGLDISRYDAVFIFSYGREGPDDPFNLNKEPDALKAITDFMQAGGGLFATGDHEDLGAAMCKDIPRVKNMRLWNRAQQKCVPSRKYAPSRNGCDRLTTVFPGRSDFPCSNDDYEEKDQSDQFPQRIHPNFRTRSGGIGFPHPLLQIPGSKRAIEVLPDHPHEGECVIPSDMGTATLYDGKDEWPAIDGVKFGPEIVALSMSSGPAMPSGNPSITFEAVEPRSFIAICAYNGHCAGVGRVVTDSSWHHFINWNIQSPQSKLTGRDLDDIKQYYTNLATWLMPENIRQCFYSSWIRAELDNYPLFEEIPRANRNPMNGQELHDIGALVERALLSRHTRSEVEELRNHALEEAIGAENKYAIESCSIKTNSRLAHDVGLTAIGAMTFFIAHGLGNTEEEITLKQKYAFENGVRTLGKDGVMSYLDTARKKFNTILSAIESIIIQ